MMKLQEMSEITKVIAIYPEGDENLYNKNQMVICPIFETQKHKPNGGTRGKFMKIIKIHHLGNMNVYIV